MSSGLLESRFLALLLFTESFFFDVFLLKIIEDMLCLSIRIFLSFLEEIIQMVFNQRDFCKNTSSILAYPEFLV